MSSDSPTDKRPRVLSLCRADKRGPKQQVPELVALRGLGIEGDVHAGTWHRQVSLLASEQIAEQQQKMPADVKLEPGAFGENIVTEGLDLVSLPIGRRMQVGADVVLQLTQIGKPCHERCAIYYQTGDCIMPRQGVFARVVRGGQLTGGDEILADGELDVVHFAVVTLSDRRAATGARQRQSSDPAGDLACELLTAALPGAKLVARKLLADDREAIERALLQLCDDQLCDLIVTTGGTGLSPRDVTPEATAAVIEREIPGMAEAIRAAGLAHTPRAMLSRGRCGLRGSTIIINLSGSPKAVGEQLEAVTSVLAHAIETASGVPQSCARQRHPHPHSQATSGERS